MRIVAVAVVVVAVVSSLTGAAEAQRRRRQRQQVEEMPAPQPLSEDDRRARHHFEAGTSYFDAGDNEAALREYQRAYELSRRPELFHNMSLVYESMGDFENAHSHLRRYLDEAANVQDRHAHEGRLVTLEERIEEQRRRRADEEAREREREARLAQERSDVPDADEASVLPLPTWISWGVGAAGLATFGIFGALTIAEDSRLADECLPARMCSAAEAGTLDTYALISDIGLLAAVAGGVVGLVFLLMSDGGEQPSAPPAVSLAPFAGPDVAGLAARGSL